jgi:hypothetical protein
MKMYMVSINTADSVRRFVFANAFKRFAGMQINLCCYDKLGVERARVGYDDWDMLPRTMREATITDVAALDVAVRAYAEYIADNHDAATTHTVEEVKGDMLKWFMTWGLQFTYRMCSDLCDHLAWGVKRDKMRSIISNMEERFSRLHGNPVQWRISYKGATYRSECGFKTQKDFCASMGKLIAESIKERDDLFSDTFMDEYDVDADLHNRIAQAANDALRGRGIDFGLDEFHCDHWDYRGNGSEVNIGRGRTRAYCHSCVEDSDTVIETYDSGILMLRDQAYYCANNEEYYEYEPEDQYDDSDSDDNDGDTDRLMSYSANVLDFLEKDNSFVTSPFGEFHMGVELELVTSGGVSSAIDDLRNQLGAEYMICKSDGSLPDGGVEIVTAPRGLLEHIKRFKDWEINSYYRAWNTGKCGMHVHVDSRAFTRMTLGKFIVFINDAKNAEFIRKIAGRHPHIDTQAQTYCAAEGQEAMENPSKALKGKSSNRYYMVNTTCLRSPEANRLGVRYVGERSFNTIELRVFRASLKKERLLAQIEFTHAVIMFCRIASMRDLNGVSFLKWLKTTDNRYPHLADWYGIRRRAGAKNAAPTEVNCADNLVATTPSV